MAGTLFGLPLSQRVDSNGDPAVGWLLYLYAANTSTPVNSYQDTGLTVLNTWPVEADASGMMGVFWLADGSYRARATSNDGSIVFFDMPNILAIGASTGAAPPSGVDPNAIFQTGDVMWLDASGARTGWVRDNGLTIGSATSGANERANADCQALFEFLWNTFIDTICPVIPGRGSNALADWTANKKITLPDKRGCGVGGLDDMGNSAAGAFPGFVPINTVGGSFLVPGTQIGESGHTLAGAEMPIHNHTAASTSTDSGHTHPESVASSSGTQKPTGSGSAPFDTNSTGTTGTGNANITTTTTIGNSGGNQTHNNVPLIVLGTFYRRL